MAGEADALALAARERAGRAGQRQIFQAHIVEKLQPFADLFQDALGDFVLLGVQLIGEGLEPALRFPDRHVGDFADMEACDLHRERLGLQAIAVARFARLIGLITLQLLAHPVGLGFAPAPFDIGDHALERLLGLVAPYAVVIDEGHIVDGAVEHDLAEVLGKILPWSRHGLLVVLCHRFECLLVIGRGRARARPGRDGAAIERERVVRHDQVRLEKQFRAEPVAFGAGAVGVVEREQARLDFLDRKAGDRAGEFRREDDPWVFVRSACVGEFGDGNAVRKRQRRLERVRQPRRHVGPHHDPVHDHVDIVFQLLVELRRFRNLVERAVDFDALKALFLKLRQLLAILAFPARSARADRAACFRATRARDPPSG